MKIKHIAMASALLTVGLIPLASAQDDFGSAQEGIEVITVVGKRPTPEGIEVITVVGKRPTQEGIEVITVVGKRAAPEGIEVITVVGKRPEPTIASTCVNQVMASRAQDGAGFVDAQAIESRHEQRNLVRQAIRNCIDQAQTGAAHS